MSALTEEPFHAVEVEQSPEQLDANRRLAEKILGRKLPPRPTTVTAGKRDQ